MSTQLFGPNAGGSFADKLAQARTFLDNARGQATPAVDAGPVTHGLAAEGPAAAQVAEVAPDVAPGAAAPTGVDVAVPVTTAAGHDPDGLAAAARAAAEQSIADPNYATAATQNVEVVVQPRVMVQGQQGPIVVPVDIAVPAAQTNVTVAPATAVVLDPATGQVVAAPAAGAAPAAAPVAGQAADVAAPATRGFRSWGIEDLANLGRGRVAAPATTPAPTPAPATTVAAEAPAAASGGGWRANIENMLLQGRGGAAAADGPAATVVTEAAAPAAAAGGGGWRAKVEDALGLAKAGGAAPAAEVVDTPVVAAAGGGGWRSRVEDALGLAKAGGAAPAAEVVADAPKVGLLDRIRESTAGIGELVGRSGAGGAAAAAEAVAPVADDVAKAIRPGLGAELRAAVEAAKIAR